jgi:hypothetical protein
MTKAAELAKMGEVLTNSQIGGRRNLIINGAMQISQRATSASAQSGATSYPCLDRFRHEQTTTAGRYTVSQESITDLEGFGKALKIACTTADTSIASTERFMLVQRIEGFNLQGLEKGFSTAKPVTASFYVKGHDSATYVVALYDVDNDRFIGQTFSVTTSWARQTVTFAGDTTGKLVNDNTNNLELRFYIHAGSNYTSGTLDTSWGTTTNANTAVGINSIFESTSATFFITGVQLEIGSQATPFEHMSFSEDLELCQRYFELKDGGICNGMSVSTTSIQSGFSYRVPKRAPASLSLQGTVYSNDGGVQAELSAVTQAHSKKGGTYLIFTSAAIQNDTILTIYSQSEVQGLAIDSEL